MGGLSRQWTGSASGVVLDPAAKFAGFAQSQTNDPVSRGLRPDKLLLVKVKNGETVHFLAGAAWDPKARPPSKTGDLRTAYLANEAARLNSPVKVTTALDSSKSIK